MARLALCAVGLGLAAPSAWAEHSPGSPLDNAALIQMSKEGADYSTDIATDSSSAAYLESLEVLGGLLAEAGYAFEKYDEGMLVEGRTMKGKWVPCVIKSLRPGDVWDIHVADTLPGYDLPGVPAHLLRRRLDKDETDWHVDNSRLQHKGFGVAYRLSKSLNNLSSVYAPFDSIVVGRDEGDGWLKVRNGYLPMQLQGERVLFERPREQGPVKISRELRDWYVKEEEARQKAAQAKLALQPPPPQAYADSEEVSFKTKDGAWRRAQVASHGLFPDTYNLLVGPAWGSKSTALFVPSSQLHKAGLPQHTPVEGESPLCQKQGCMPLRLRTESGKEYKLRAAMGLRIHVIMQAACARIHEPWETCQTRLVLSHRGRTLSPSWRTYEAGLTSDSVVDLKLAPVTATPVSEVSA